MKNADIKRLLKDLVEEVGPYAVIEALASVCWKASRKGNSKLRIAKIEWCAIATIISGALYHPSGSPIEFSVTSDDNVCTKGEQLG